MTHPTAAELIPQRLKAAKEAEGLAWVALRRAPRSRQQKEIWLELNARVVTLQNLALDLGLITIDEL